MHLLIKNDTLKIIFILQFKKLIENVRCVKYIIYFILNLYHQFK